MLPLKVSVYHSMGSNRHTRLGTKSIFMMLAAVTWPPIHSMMVVTSPMGLHAPPALAAITTMPARIHRSCLSFTSLRSNAHITIVVVMLSSAALRKKVMVPTTQMSIDFRWPVMWSVITRNPSCASTSSTIVMAPMRKKRMLAISDRCSSSWWLISSAPCASGARSALWPSTMSTQMSTPVTRAVAALLMLSGCSRAMAR